ncbi:MULTISPECIES: hypothetical protein [unclassified Coleofasciculus]|uniref:hypothetical protein n=1 Tax=unclassified Coleofasciculus TaxID=2692782 RepID=UPI00188007A3|nr:MULTISPECIES: hypothetical protein [unclassified Coleofasciculus]MBE9126896.1 hypothetical protein [Coleofasciculus sp. LEGE 07081]MBE9150208.1 hypothetical protein [Coleofasciculus sp. LEGE 07092]
MKELLLNPLILCLLFFAAIVYLAIGFQLINGNSKWTKSFEMICIVTLMLSIAGIGKFGLAKFHPQTFYLRDTTLPSLAMKLGIFGSCFLFLYSRIKANSKKLFSVFFY